MPRGTVFLGGRKDFFFVVLPDFVVALTGMWDMDFGFHFGFWWRFFLRDISDIQHLPRAEPPHLHDGSPPGRFLKPTPEGGVLAKQQIGRQPSAFFPPPP